MSGPLVSAVVLTRDRPGLLQRCLASLRANTYRPLEIVVLDNGAPDSRAANRAATADWGDDPALTLVESQPDGFAALRLAAWARARGEIVVSIDDDCEAAPDMIGRVVERFAADGTLGLVGGRLENVGFDGAERLKGRGVIGLNGRYEPVEDPAQAEVFGSANQSVRRAAYDEVGGYDPFFRDGMEEADLALSLSSQGWGIAYEPDARVTHHHSPQRFRRRWRNLDTMRLYLFLKHRPPRAAGWLRFAADEMVLFGRDLGALWPGRPRREGRPLVLQIPRVGLWLAIGLVQRVTARLMLPWIAWRAARARRAAARRPRGAGR